MTLFFDVNHERNVTPSRNRSTKTFAVAPVHVAILHVPVPVVPIHSTRRPTHRLRMTLSGKKSTGHTATSSSIKETLGANGELSVELRHAPVQLLFDNAQAVLLMKRKS